jgi:hypothetical protein
MVIAIFGHSAIVPTLEHIQSQINPAQILKYYSL